MLRRSPHQRALDRVHAPRRGFVLPPPYRVVGSVGDLRQVGARLRNCLRSAGSYGVEGWFRLIDGSTVYVACDKPPLLAALRRVGPDLFHLEQVQGPNNQFVGPGGQAMLVGALRAAGVRLLTQEPSRALSSLSAHTRKASEADDDLG